MMPEDDVRIPKHHYNDLIAAATQMAAVGANAAATILEGTPYESMLRGPSEALKSALENVPGGSSWDGEWRDSDVEVTPFRHHSQPDRSGPDAGAKAVHMPTGLQVGSYMKPSFEANRNSAVKALMNRVERYAQDQGIIPT